MTLKTNKLAVLEHLSLEIEPITLPNLLLKLGKEFKERSVRRWLAELVQEGSVKKIGEKRGTKYVVPGQAQEKNGSCFSSASLQVIKQIKKPLFERTPISYVEAFLGDYRPNSDFYVSKSLRNQLFKAGQRASLHDPAGTYAHQIFNRLLIDLSYNSSRLEGNTYSLLDTERLVIHRESVPGKLDKEKIMILNHKEAIRYLVENAAKIEITHEVICTLHYLLSEGLVDVGESGKVRKHGVRIGGSVYLPMESSKLLNQGLEKIVKKAAQIEDPFEQSFFLLVHISYLQAFVDVNERTARLSANISLIKNNVVPLSFNDVRVDDYMSAMIAVYELQNVQPLVDLYFYSYLRTCVMYDSTVEALGFDAIRVRYRHQRRSMIRRIILEKKVGEELTQYIQMAVKEIPEGEREAFIEDLEEDLEHMDVVRLAGLGVEVDQLNQWLHMREKKS